MDQLAPDHPRDQEGQGQAQPTQQDAPQRLLRQVEDEGERAGKQAAQQDQQRECGDDEAEPAIGLQHGSGRRWQADDEARRRGGAHGKRATEELDHDACQHQAGHQLGLGRGARGFGQPAEELAGFVPQTSFCALCGTPEPEHPDPHSGQMLCRPCAAQPAYVPDVLAYLRNFPRQSVRVLMEAPLSVAGRTELWRALERFVAVQVGRVQSWRVNLPQLAGA
ncbi:MAG: DNA repair protein RecO C-terminal domain-containing protein [Rubritepida sp.]|nr:DNA repair protein RecO C-terminal domain-containing protein [Rubritepida sp.]